jgi:hypothetical protein
MASKTNTRKAGFKKVEASCSKRAKKTMKLLQSLRPLKAKNHEKRTEEYIKSCAKKYTFKQGKWVPKCDEMAERVSKILADIGKAISKKPVSKAEKQKMFNQAKANCLKEYTLK